MVTLNRRTRTLALLAVAIVLTACGNKRSSPPGSAARNRSLGEVMAEVARRFELAGHAAKANRFELARFEARELGERFENDVPNAELPAEGPTAHIPAMARAFLQKNIPELTAAAEARDAVAFASAFRDASAVCNACHRAAAKGFIEVPSEPGRAVPDLDPLPAPSPRPTVKP